jgi:hypothetical protein
MPGNLDFPANNEIFKIQPVNFNKIVILALNSCLILLTLSGLNILISSTVGSSDKKEMKQHLFWKDPHLLIKFLTPLYASKLTAALT